ncbi:MAG: DUF1214 domain-containing protein [Polyangiaceae bacterium]|nr:DUF1214 domain-containing protein [Polyangiaceae bacterium]
MDDKAAKVIDGRAWNEFCDALKNAGSIILSPDHPSDPLTRAEGFRYLSRLARAALQTFVEHNDPRAPVLQRVVHETAKMGADNPNIVYSNAALSGAHRYILRGKRGTVHFLSFATQIGHYGRGAGMPPTGQLDSKGLSPRADGSFEVILSTEKPDLEPGQSWLPMTPETGTLLVRQVRLRADETLADLRIERLAGDPRPDPLTAEMLADGLESSGQLVGGATMLFAAWTRMFQAHTNELPRFDPEISNRFGGLADVAYYHSYWKLDEDQALVIDATPPPCDHWNFQLNNHWMESLDYRYFKIQLNSAGAVLRPDGSVRVVVAAQNPGVDNWLETAGHTFGTMCWRWWKPEVDDPPQPQSRVVRISEVKGLA